MCTQITILFGKYINRLRSRELFNPNSSLNNIPDVSGFAVKNLENVELNLRKDSMYWEYLNLEIDDFNRS